MPTFLTYRKKCGKNVLFYRKKCGILCLRGDFMKKIEYAFQKYVNANDIKRVRNLLNMSQKRFAEFIGTSTRTIETWERSEKEITGPIVLLLDMIENNIEYIDYKIIPEKKYPIRMFYMKNQMICTLIDVDTMEQKVSIKNFTNNLIYRAFGKNENPTYGEFEDFLKSRCFPETRDKLKLVLEDLNLPFYDPFLIVEKTEGRMAEDDFWIKIER